MRPMRFAKMVGYSVLVTVALGAVTYVAATGVPSLQEPVQVEEAAFLADGGSFHIVLRDAQGTRFAVGAQGSLSKPRAEFALYTQRWWPYLPIPTYVRRGSEIEQDLQRSVQAWLGQAGPDEAGRMALTQLAGLLQDRVSTERRQ